MSDSIRSLVSDGRAKKLQPRDWLEIVNLAETGVKIRKISEIYGVQQSLIYKGLHKRKVNIVSIGHRVAAEEMEKTKVALLEKIRETKDNDYKFTEFLQKQIIASVVKAQKGSVSISTEMDNIKTLKIALDGMRVGTANKWLILGLNNENEKADAALPDLPIRPLTDNEIDGMREKQESDDGLLMDDSEAELDEISASLDAEDDAIEDIH